MKNDISERQVRDTADHWAHLPGLQDAGYRFVVHTLSRTFGDAAWEGLGLVRQLAVLADFIDMARAEFDGVYGQAAGVYAQRIGRQNLGVYSDSMLINLRRACGGTR